MTNEAYDAGRNKAKLCQKDYPKVHILTVECLLARKECIDAAPQITPFAKVERELNTGRQEEIL